MNIIGGCMKRCSVLAVPPLLLLLVQSLHPLHAQARRGVLSSVGAHVKTQFDSGAQSVEGIILAWRGDTLLVQARDRADTVRIASGALQKLRIVESPALWRYTSPGDIN